MCSIVIELVYLLFSCLPFSVSNFHFLISISPSVLFSVYIRTVGAILSKPKFRSESISNWNKL